MSVRRVVYIADSPFSQRDFDRFGVGQLRARGYGVEVWDCSGTLAPQRRGYRPVDHCSDPDVRILEGDAIGRAADALHADDVVIAIFELVWRNLWLLRRISRSAARFGFLSIGACPAPPWPWKRRLLRALRSPSAVRDAIARRAPPRWLRVRHGAFVLAGPGALQVPRSLLGPETAVVRIHTLDYDLYLTHLQSVQDGPHDYAVFLDQHLPYHPDYLDEPTGRPIDPDHYYAAIRGCFDAVERETGTPVVIALHPRSDASPTQARFGDRLAVAGRTVELVSGARFVLAHASTAMNFAVLYEKPIVFLTISGLSEVDRGVIDAFARSVEKVPIGVDSFPRVDWTSELQVDREAYQRYRERYIKQAGTPEVPFWSVAADFFAKM